MTGYDLTIKMRKARRRHPLTATEQALFYELVAICNEVDWEEVFTASNDELCHALNISENTLNVARMALINAKLIHYASGKSKRQYSKYSFTKKLTPSKSDTNAATNPSTNPATVHGVDAATVDEKTTSNSEDYNKPIDTTVSYTQTETKPSEVPGAVAPTVKISEEVKTDPDQKEKSSAQKEKGTQHWKSLVSEWFRFYGQQFDGAEADFSKESASNLKELVGKIKKRVETHPTTKDQEWDEGNAVNWLRMFLVRAWQDKWLKEHFLLKNLNSQFSAIVDNHAKSNSKNRVESANDNLAGELAAHYASLAGQG